MNRSPDLLSWINVFAGTLLIHSPLMLGYSGFARTNDIITGTIIFILGLLKVFNPARGAWISMVNLLVGVWLVAFPFLNGFTGNILISDVAIGTIAIITGAASTSITYNRRHSFA